jgi:hypothetical protein
MITVQGKALGRKQPLFADWVVPFPPDLHQGGDNLTLRDLISRIVRQEVALFQERQQERRLLHALTAKAIAAGVVKGKVEMGGRNLQQAVDVEEAVSTALQAFEDGLYLVMLDGQEQRDLDREVYLQPDSQVMFVRLTLLAGG